MNESSWSKQTPADIQPAPALPADLAKRFRRNRLRADAISIAFLLPLLLFLGFFFLVPIGATLKESVSDRDVRLALPMTADKLQRMAWATLPDPDLIATFSAELSKAKTEDTVGAVARRMNTEISGFRSLIGKTARAVAEKPVATIADLKSVDRRWGEVKYWSALKNASSSPSPYYVLAALDLKRGVDGSIERQPADLAIFVPILVRTLVVSLAVTLICMVMAVPTAYFLVGLRGWRAGLGLFLVMLPFWTSALVRITGWTVILQKDGLLNQLLMAIAPISAPLDMMYTEFSMYVGLVHLMLPFMIVPIYSAMRQIDPATVKAALSLGARPAAAFRRVFLPQCVSGIGAGAAIVFILTLGSYTTPVLLGGAGEQMVSYFISFYTNQMLNWNMGAALSVMLLAVTIVACLIGRRFLSARAPL